MRLERSAARQLMIIVFGVLALVSGGGLWLANSIRVARAEVREYREQHAEAKIVGKTAYEIIAMYGRPYSGERGPDGKPVFMMYKQVEHGQYCGIALKDGVAVKVSFDFQ
jgi:hypothetical protein